MVNEVTTIKKNNDLISFSSQEMNLIQKQFFPQSASNLDIDYCMGVAKSLGLNPITKEIWFVERKSKVNNSWVTKVEPMAGRDSYLKIANRNGGFGGIETNIELKEIPYLNKGNWVFKKDLVAVCKVYKKGIDKPFISEVIYSEYVQTKQDGTPTKFWAEKPHTMLKKVAESQALRKAFNINNLYDESEIRDDNDGSNHKPAVKTQIQSDAQKAYHVEQLQYTVQDLHQKYKEYDLGVDDMKKFNNIFGVIKTDPNTFKDIIDNFDDYFDKFQAETVNDE